MNQSVDDLTVEDLKCNDVEVEVLSQSDMKDIALIIKELSVNFNKERILDLIRDRLCILFLGYNINTINKISAEANDKCAMIIKSLWHVSQDSFLEQIKLLLIDHYSHIGLLEAGIESNGVMKKNLTKYQIYCGIFEIMHIYFYLLKMTSTNKIIFSREISWPFVNSGDLFGSKIYKNIIDSGRENQIVTDSLGSNITLQIVELHEILNNTLDIDLMKEQIKKYYSVEKIYDIIQDSELKKSIGHEQIKAYIVYDFLTNIELVDYLKK